MRWKWLLLIVCSFIAACGAGIGWLYAHPPLVSNGMGRLYDDADKTLAYGVGLENTGRWPLVLTGVTIGGREVEYPQAMAVANFSDGQLADNAALKLHEYGHKLEIGAVPDWQIQPQHRLQWPSSYGLRIDWEAALPDEVVLLVHYRYLGLPMHHDVSARWPTTFGK